MDKLVCFGFTIGGVWANLQYFLSGANSCLGIAKNVKLSDIHLNGRWLLRPARSDPQVFLQAYLSIVTLKN
ncbi:hypothetical protein Bca4012_018808 [Brassica carinata]|uniref:Uncharacterized protein n=1 Tax=Brassica carinata TaxID=52824 RepID=A0A8X7WP19_BRACI|nr:hypothetical protein Bca52824_002798 [Brassica carinata]